MFKKISLMMLLLVLTVSWSHENTDKKVLVSKKSDKITFSVEESEFTVEKSSIKAFSPKNKNDYMGCYAYGFSEGEYTLRVILDKKGIIIQKVSYELNPKDDLTFMKAFKNIELNKVSSNKFSNKENEASFVKLKVDKKMQKGLLFTKLKWKFSEFGTKNTSFEKCLTGKYKKTFYKYLTKDDIKGLSKKELQIMRNEIFARYGYKFKTGGKMNKHFSKKSWYKAQNTNVDNFLTKIEKANITFLKKQESLKK